MANGFGWVDLKVRFPLIGYIARNKRNITKGAAGWLAAEEGLCSRYKRYFSQITEEKFNQRIEYMRNAGDLGRTPMSMGLMALLFILVAAEGMGFSYLLATYITADGSANLYTQLMYGFVFVMATILAMATHAAGGQFYRTSLIRSSYQRYKELNGQEYASHPIALSGDQFADAKDPTYMRCVNRVVSKPHDRGSYGWSWVAGALVACIFIASFTMRVSHMEGELTRQAAAEEATSNPFASKLPADVVAPQKSADAKAKSEEKASARIEGVSAMLILGVIFVVTQIVGFGAGYKHKFAGTETYKTAGGTNGLWFWSRHDGAYAETQGFSTYDAYWESWQPLKDLVNERLKALQTAIRENAHENLTLSKTFEDYMLEMDKRSADYRTGNQAIQAQNITPMQPQYVPAQLMPTHPAPIVLPVIQTAQMQAPTLEMRIAQAKSDIEGIVDVQAQRAFFGGLSLDVKAALAPWLKERKEERERAAINEEELF